MTSERLVRILAGGFVLLSLALGAPASPSITAATGCGSPPLSA
jgi:hypothetical protein